LCGSLSLIQNSTHLLAQVKQMQYSGLLSFRNVHTMLCMLCYSSAAGAFDIVHVHGLTAEPNAQVEWQLQQQS